MTDNSIILPSQPMVIKEDDFFGVFEIDGLYPGYGHTLGNSIRRIVLSSLPGVAIVGVKIEGVNHEFSVIEGVKEDVVTILLNLRQVRMKMTSDEPQVFAVKKTGPGEFTAGDLSDSNSNVEVINNDLPIATLADKKTEVNMEVTVERGLGYVPKESLKREKSDVGVINMDAVFTPIRRVSYEVENMRVGDRTDFNKLRINIETDGTISPRRALEQSIEIMINQLQAIVGFKTESSPTDSEELEAATDSADKQDQGVDAGDDDEVMKIRIESLDLSDRVQKALAGGNIRTVGGLIRKKSKDLLDLEGLGQKGLGEVEKVLIKFGLNLKADE